MGRNQFLGHDHNVMIIMINPSFSGLFSPQWVFSYSKAFLV